MDELARKLEALRGDFNPPWGEARRNHAYRGVERLQRRRRRRNAAAVATLGVAAAVALLSWRGSWSLMDGVLVAPSASSPHPPEARTHDGMPPALPVVAAPAPNRPLAAGTAVRLADGSHATVASPETRLFLELNQPENIQLRLASGLAHFEVIPALGREFSVLAGAIEVVVIGTSFDTERTGDRVRVAVQHGKVRVRSHAGDVYLEAGESRWFEERSKALAGTPPANIRAGAGPAKHEASRRGGSALKEQARIEWRNLTQSGDYERAYRLLEKGAPVDDDAEALMDAADAARLTGHLEVAVRYLRKVLTDHRTSPAAPLAAFTLGRALLGQLGRPSEAAEAFALVRELSPDGSLSQDALAREVEAWSKAGHPEEAYRRARLFLERYPDSRRARVVRLYGGLGHP